MDSDPLEAARAILPIWVVWGAPLVWIPGSALVALAIAALSARLATRRFPPPGAHWSERARLAFPARRAALFNLLFLPIVLGYGAGEMIGPLLPARWTIDVLVPLAAFLAAAWVRLRVERRVRERPVSAGEWAASYATFAVVFLPHILLAAVLSAWIEPELDALSICALAISLAGCVAATRGAGCELGRLVGLARRASPRVEAIVKRAAERTGIPARGAYELRWSILNAVAFPFGRRVAFTAPAVDALADDELTAIAAHELGHFSEPPSSRVLRFGIALLLTTTVAAQRPIAAHLGLLGYLSFVLAMLLVVLLLLRFFQKMERHADRVAHGAGHDDTDGTYARALERIYELNVSPAAVHARLATHPSLYDRMLAAGATPSYPRPQPPPAAPLRLAVASSAIAASVGVISSMGAAYGLDASSEDAALVSVMALGGQPRTIYSLGMFAAQRGDHARAATLLELAAMLDVQGAPMRPSADEAAP